MTNKLPCKMSLVKAWLYFILYMYVLNKPPSTSLQGQGEGYGAFCFKYYKEKYKHEENWRFKDHSNNSNILSWSKPENPVSGPSFLKEKTSGAPSVSGSAGPKRKFQFTKVTPRRMTKTYENEKVTPKRITKTYKTGMTSRVTTGYDTKNVTPGRITGMFTPSRITTGDGTEKVTPGTITKGYLKEKVATLIPTFRAPGRVQDLWDWGDKQPSLETVRSLRDYTPQPQVKLS